MNSGISTLHCPLRVKSGRKATPYRCLVYPRKRTLAGRHRHFPLLPETAGNKRNKNNPFLITPSARAGKGGGTPRASPLGGLGAVANAKLGGARTRRGG